MPSPASNTGAPDIAREKAGLKTAALIVVPVTVGTWFAIFVLLPPLAGMADPVARIILAVQCCCAAVLFCFLTGIEAVAHERLRSAAIDPLLGFESHRLRVNLRYLQNTLEQLLLFIPGLIGLAVYCDDASAMRAVVAVTVVWIISRFAFWIGYHFGARYRAFGLSGMLQSMLVLLYVCARFGFDVAGVAGALAPLVLFGAIEAFLVYATRPVAGQPGAARPGDEPAGN